MHAPVIADLQKAVSFIKDGRVVGFPTGTSYGLAVDALQGHALVRLGSLKKRPEDKTFTVCIAEELWGDYLALTSYEQDFLREHASQTLTLLVTPKDALTHLAKDGRIGLRVVDHPLMETLVNTAKVPLTATSANVSAEKPCYAPHCVAQAFPWVVDAEDSEIAAAGPTTYDMSLACVLDGGVLAEKPSSTIMVLEGERPRVVRPGAFKL